MVRVTLIRSFWADSCCSLAVVNGAEGLRFFSLVSRLVTFQAAFRIMSRRLWASASAPIRRLVSLLPSWSGRPAIRVSFIQNWGGSLAANLPFSTQYSTGLKACTSRSRSTIRRTVTLCTRPADRPRRTLSQSTWDTL